MSDPENYTVGWICAVYTEYVAAQTFLDEKHDPPASVSNRDDNDYTLGKMGSHNIVIACMPQGEYGTTSAANVAGHMIHSFPNIRVGLMVGIGGGVPSQRHDIRLGDVVVSTPQYDGQGGVIQYDFGRSTQAQDFQQTSFLNRPPTVLLTAVGGLKAQYELEGHQINQTIREILDRFPRLRRKYGKQDPTSDRLYYTDWVHPSTVEGSCEMTCDIDLANLIVRPQRLEDEDDPMIHHGLIASANTVMKDAHFRDRMATERDVLCFEMEAAGLMNNFPCLVVRGICDYADSHKNMSWQGYAAMTAAAYAKDLLGRVSPGRLHEEKRINEILSSVGQKMDSVSNMIMTMDNRHQQKRLREWLRPSDPCIDFKTARRKRQQGTGSWLIGRRDLQDWKHKSQSLLGLSGVPGCAITLLFATALEHLQHDQNFTPLVYSFFDSNDSVKQQLGDMFRFLIMQLADACPDSREQVEKLFTSHGNGYRQPPLHQLIDCFFKMAETVDDVGVIVDAVDECLTLSERCKCGSLNLDEDHVTRKRDQRSHLDDKPTRGRYLFRHQDVVGTI